MNRRSMLAATASAALAGCTLNKTALRQTLLKAPAGPEGVLFLPKRCEFTVRTVKGAVGEPGVDSAVWEVADSQEVGDEETRRLLEANGLRIGVITGPMPPELEKLLHAPPPNAVDTVEIVRGEGDSTLIRLTAEVEGTTETSLLMNRQGRVGGKVYQDLSGFVRISGTHVGNDMVQLRLIPELHHGPVQRRFTGDSGAGPYAPQQLMMKDGQEEEALRDLAVSINLRPGQVAVLGPRTDRPSSLGPVLLIDPGKGGERDQQRLILLTVRRNIAFEQARTKLPTPTALQPVEPDADRAR
ncbi:MAG: hypothetical protein U0800_17860 [Isosphaeraceae bacterium]